MWILGSWSSEMCSSTESLGHSPYHPEVWEHYLKATGLMHKLGHIIQGLQIGFKVDLPLITITQTPPNRNSIVTYSKPFHDIIHNELRIGRYIGPFTKDELEDTIGPFQSSPFSIIPKSTIRKYCILQNYSFPYEPTTTFLNPSVNSYINSDNYPTT